MGLNRLVLIMFVFVLFSVSSVMASVCGNIAVSTILDSNVGTEGDCFTITASHVILDCRGFNITYGTAAGHGVNLGLSPGQGNVTVKNCVFNQDVSVGGESAIRSYGNFFNNTFWNNTILSRSSVSAIIVYTNNNTNVSQNTIIQYGSGAFNGHGIDVGNSYNNFIDNNFVNTTVDNANGILLSIGNATIRANVLNTTGANAYGISLDRMVAGTIVQENRIKTSGSESSAISVIDSNNLVLRSNTLQVSTTFMGSGLDFSDVNNSLVDNNTIEINSISPFNGALVFLGITANNVIVNNNITAPQGGNEILDTFGEAIDTTYYNYLIYNNSYGEIAWMNNGTGSFLHTMTISVNGSLNLGETILIGDNFAAVNTSAFTPEGRINGSANITLRGLSGDTLDSITKDHAFVTSAGQIVGNDCVGSGCTTVSFSSGVLKFLTTSFSSFTTSTSGGAAVPEFSEYAMMFIVVIGIGGFLVMKQKEE